MADVHQVSFYPVGNSDTTQIVLSGGRRVLLDFCHRNEAEDSDTPEIDLKARLKDDLKKVDRDYFYVVVFTHADLDHIQGSTDLFELQHAKKYHGEGLPDASKQASMRVSGPQIPLSGSDVCSSMRESDGWFRR